MVTVASITPSQLVSAYCIRLVFDNSDRMLVERTWALPESAHPLLRLRRVSKVVVKTTCNLRAHLCKFYDVPLEPSETHATEMFIDTNVAW